MKFQCRTPLMRAGAGVVPAFAGITLDETMPAAARPKFDRFGISSAVSTGPPKNGIGVGASVEANVTSRGASRWRSVLYWLIAFCAIASPMPAASQPAPAGSKLVGNFTDGPAYQGWSVALSADGSTAIVGGTTDNKLTGAVWVFSHSGKAWTQEGSKLIGSGAVGQGGQGASVALSADGNTAVVGGPYDDSMIGATWVYVRSGARWTQQGRKLIGTGAIGNAGQGMSVALSADGNTLIVGGPEDNRGTGAAWVFTRSGGAWTQQGDKLVGSDLIGTPSAGTSVALSADGNTAIIGGPYDNSNIGAVWVFTRTGGLWRQQGNKLVGTGAAGRAGQGFSVALSADGSILLAGGLGDDSNTGAAWVFTRLGALWAQQGRKLVGSGAVGMARQGHSAALSADGNTAMVGGPYDNSYAGAAWVYTRGGGKWTQQGDKLIGSGSIGRAEQGYSVALSADGNLAIAGGIADDMVVGAAWVHARSSGLWAPVPAPAPGF